MVRPGAVGQLPKQVYPRKGHAARLLAQELLRDRSERVVECDEGVGREQGGAASVPAHGHLDDITARVDS